jgi:hypothetical protein
MGMIGMGILAALALLGDAPDSAGTRYAEGQVWEYRTRPGDENSLLKIQKVNDPDGPGPAEPIYHLSAIGVDLGPGVVGMLPHFPVSRETLDASVTRLSLETARAFPSATAGIEEWREANGGVFNIPVAQIIGIARDTLAQR